MVQMFHNDIQRVRGLFYNKHSSQGRPGPPKPNITITGLCVSCCIRRVRVHIEDGVSIHCVLKYELCFIQSGDSLLVFHSPITIFPGLGVFGSDVWSTVAHKLDVNLVVSYSTWSAKMCVPKEFHLKLYCRGI